MDTAVDDVALEQAYIDRAYDELERMRAHALKLLREQQGFGGELDLLVGLARRVDALRASGRPLCFGRIDEESGDVWYIGRRHVEDAAGDPVVIEWRVPIAVPFYRATPGEPLGLERRRQFVLDGQKLVSIGEDDFAALQRAGAESRPRVRGGDALLVELERSRTGEMLDIVATIQAEQDEVIRAPLEGVLVVQGGPGSGKTAVGLHRAAFLLYGNEVLARAGVLVLGPNRTFLRYIGQVLPSLGEEAVIQTTFRDLVADVRVTGEDAPEAARVKGDRRMAEVLRRALAARRRDLDAAVTMAWGATTMRLPAAEGSRAMRQIAERDIPYAVGRDALRERLLRRLHEHYAARSARVAGATFADLSTALRNDAGFKAAIDRLWPTVSPTGLVRELVTSPTALRAAADGVLSEDEQRLVVRKPVRRVADEPWTEADVALIDEAAALIDGVARTYGHIVVDEAQDLSPMQVRMLARRCPTGSLTILGDVAQGIGPWAHEGWDEVVDDLPTPNGSRIEELRLGYRAPAQVIELASRLLPVAAPDVRPTDSVRIGRHDPVILRVAAPALVTAGVAEAERLAADEGSVGLIVPSGLAADAGTALTAAGVDWGDATQGVLTKRVSLVPAVASKGLEFDAVVVVEPAAIVEDAPRGLRLLYVALTRPTQRLSIVHAADLPAPLA